MRDDESKLLGVLEGERVGVPVPESEAREAVREGEAVGVGVEEETAPPMTLNPKDLFTADHPGEAEYAKVHGSVQGARLSSPQVHAGVPLATWYQRAFHPFPLKTSA